MPARAFSRLACQVAPILVVALLSQPVATFAKDDAFPAPGDKVLKGSITQASFVTPAYVVSPGDVLSFSVDEEPDFDQESLIVRPDGYVTIRPVGQIMAAGRTVRELTKELERNLTDHINNPEVYLSVQRFQKPRVYLLGAVEHPGPYKAVQRQGKNATVYTVDTQENGAGLPNLTISNAIITSGGVSFNADLSHIHIRKKNGNQTIVDLVALFLRGDVTQDVLLESGDVVTVPTMDIMPFSDDEFKLLSGAGVYPDQFPIRVLGEVGKAGLFYVSSDTPYLNTAIAMAEGFERGALTDAVVVQRKSRGQDMASIVVDPGKVDLMLRPNDVIEVKDSNSAKVVRGMVTLSKMAAPLWWIGRL